MSMSPRVSVVVPAWNAAATIGDALASIAAQTRPVDDVIVVDDGSTDATAAIVEGVPGPVRLIRQANAGAPAAIEAALSVAEGSLVTFLDSDDLWRPEKTARQIAALSEDSGLAGVYGFVEMFVDGSASEEQRRRWVVPEGPQAGRLLGALMVRREWLASVGPFAAELRTGFHIDWHHRAELAGARFATLPETVLLRRLRPGSLSQPSTERNRSYLEVARRALARRKGNSA